MLSRAAGNALLKTLEEPPDHVVFVLATTEPYKLLDTIRSRSQRFDFRPVADGDLVEHLAAIAALEGIDAEPDALATIAVHASGSVRDGMSMLEQVAAYADAAITLDTVGRTLGLADREAFATLVTAVAEGDAPSALGLVAELAARGTDLRRFVAEAIEYFRGIFLAQYAPNLEEIVDESADTLAEWARLAETIPRARRAPRRRHPGGGTAGAPPGTGGAPGHRAGTAPRHPAGDRHRHRRPGGPARPAGDPDASGLLEARQRRRRGAGGGRAVPPIVGAGRAAR